VFRAHYALTSFYISRVVRPLGRSAISLSLIRLLHHTYTYHLTAPLPPACAFLPTPGLVCPPFTCYHGARRVTSRDNVKDA